MPADMEPAHRTLHCGDAAEVLARTDAASVHLCIIDPPYYTQREWGEFTDRWRDIGEFVASMRTVAEAIHRVLVPGGALYWMGDENAIHRVWVMLEEVFGGPIRRCIAWQGHSPSGVKTTAPNWIRTHDTILYFLKRGEATARWNRQWDPHTEVREARYYETEEGTGRRFAVMNGRKCYADASPGRAVGSVWAPRVFHPLYDPYTPERMACFDRVDETGRRYQQRYDESSGGRWRQYADEYEGTRQGTVWRDFFAANRGDRTGYPTEKPTELTDRIVRASSDPGDLVLDPCCGSGTTLVSAERLGRRWMGIDRNPEAIRVARGRVGAEVDSTALIDEGPPVRVLDGSPG